MRAERRLVSRDHPRPGLLYRSTRALLWSFVAAFALAYLVTSTGLYFWFNLGSENRLRVEYGRIWWRHVEGGTARQSAGMNGGGSRIELDYEFKERAGRWDARIPLWMPLLLLFSLLILMSVLRRYRYRAVRRLAADPAAFD